jgi:hypothetical protein
VALVGAIVVAIALAVDGRLAAAGVAGAGGAYFALRLFGGLGRREP